MLGGLFQFEFYRNFAGPNNFFAGRPVLISLFAILAVAVLARRSPSGSPRRSPRSPSASCSAARSAILLRPDRIFREPSPLHGGVVDWLRGSPRLTKWMNLADLAIDAAIVAMLVAAVVLLGAGGRGEEEGKKRRENWARPCQRAGQPSE